MHDLLSFASVALVLGPALVHGLPESLKRTRVLHHARDVADSYDYVIVGGGTAGLTVADRLTEDEKTTVLVIEHGDLVESPLIDRVQGGFSGMSAQFMYSINSVPQVNLKNHSIGVLAGKVVGGSSAVNAMMTVRGTEEDYNRWGNFFSNSSIWSWEGMLPYFKKALNFVPPLDDVTEASNITYDTSYWSNTSGVYTGWPSYQYPGTKVQMDAFRQMPGVEFPPDSGSGRPGVYWFPQFMDPKTVTRSFARTGHYDKQITRENYQLIAGNKVLQIVLNGTTAAGVTFISAKNTTVSTTVMANKEVIIAAGGIHSPQVLQRSGIGPRKLLTAANISTVVDLPGVGQNFQDHPMIQMRVSLTKFNITPSSSDLFGNTPFHDWAEAAWAENKTGPYSIATGNAAAWLSFPVISPSWSDIADKLAAQDPAAQLPEDTDDTVVAGYRAQMKSYSSAMRANKTAFFNLGLSGGAGNGIMVDLHPLSRGSVNIQVSDPFWSEPVVDYRALSNPLDAAVMTEMMRFTRRFYFNNTANSMYDPREMSPGSRVQTDEDFAEYLSNTLSPTEYHPVGTCAMMPKDLGGVVDERLRVYGVKNLRVVDASIMPTLPSGNTCQTVYAVAEKAADIIKEDAGIGKRTIRRT